MPVDAEALFAWHMQPASLQRMLPPWRKIKILSSGWSPADIGSMVEIAFRIGPFWRKWVLQHTECIFGEYFVDQQVEGPLHFWRHVHKMLPEGEHSVLVDEIEFSSRLASLPWAHSRIMRELVKVFRWRQARLAGDLAAYARYPRTKMRILVSGASGLLGTNLVSFLRAGGHEVARLVRRPSRAPDAILWNPENGTVSPEALEGFNAIIHLAGTNIAGKRWSSSRKKELFQSRCRDTWLLAHALSHLKTPPAVFISASAVGFYGDRGESELSEESEAGKGFLADLCQHWERTSEVLEECGARVVHTRLGAVIAPEGGMLQRLLPLFRLGLGAVLGKGDQWMSWIAIDDAVDAFYHVLMTPLLRGAVNFTAPQSIRNREFGQSLAKACNRPFFLRLPAPLLRVALGEMADELLLASARALPNKLTKTGFVFRNPDLNSALKNSI